MADKLISAERLKSVLTHNFGGIGAAAVMEQLIDIAPPVDAVPVVHGRWVRRYTNVDGNAWLCSICFTKKPTRKQIKYCPYCGAKMDGKDGAENG